MAQVIFNADDFGRSASINLAVLRAYREGVLTSASLMVTGDAAGEAVSLARAAPNLAVGLHLVLAGGRSILPRKEIPHLVDDSGRFPGDPALAAIRYIFLGSSGAGRAELTRELTAQFDRFAATGLTLSHVDGHMHLHVHPAVFGPVVSLADTYGACGLRMPRDDLWLALGYDRRHSGTKALWAVVLGLVSRWCVRRMRGTGLVVAHRVYGLLQTGQMEEAYVLRVLLGLDGASGPPSAEIYFHPSMLPREEHLGPNSGDLATLLSPAVREVIERRNLRLATYPSLNRLLRHKLSTSQ